MVSEGKSGAPSRIFDAALGDNSAKITLTLWNELIGPIQENETILVDSGYLSLVRGHMRPNVGRYGNLSKSTETLGKINQSLDMSQQDF